MRRIYGLDLNGWHDLAVHDVRPDDVESDEITTGDRQDVFIIDGGVGGLVVDARGTSQANEPARFIGGPQAALSVIGRGPGWGPIGAADRRAAVRSSEAVLRSLGPVDRGGIELPLLDRLLLLVGVREALLKGLEMRLGESLPNHDDAVVHGPVD